MRMFEGRIGEDGKAYLSGRLDASQAEAADDFLEGLSGPVVLDLSELNYISSAGIGILMKTYKRLHASGSTIQLVNLNRHVRNVFHYAGLESIFNIE
jgi:anti-sigma B factor antagonist